MTPYKDAQVEACHYNPQVFTMECVQLARLIGWREWVSLPGLGVNRIKVKVDTGARTSVLHAGDLQSFLKDDQEWVTFSVYPVQNNNTTRIHCEAPVKEHRVIRDSGGHEETRVVIETEIDLGDERWTIELTLTDREHMAFRMLLGRKAIVNRYYVDPTQSFNLSTPESNDYDYQEEE